MNDEQFMKLFKYIQKVDAKVDSIIDNMATKDDIRLLTTIIEGYAAKIDTYVLEWPQCSTKSIASSA